MATYQPRHVYVISFDDANTDLAYFCSHDDIVIGGSPEPTVFYGDIINASTHSQGLNPIRANATIGSVSFTFLDDSQALTALINSKLYPVTSPESVGEGLRAKRVQHWIGEQGAEWSSGYDLVQTSQINDAISIVNDGKGYRFTGRDIQRSELEDIFDPKKTNLTSSLSKTGITVNVNSTTDIDLIQHGASYSDAPNDLVGYIRIKDEKIRFTSKTANTFTVDNAQTTLNGAAAKGDNAITVTDSSDFSTSGVGYILSGSPETPTEIKWTGISASPEHVLTGVTGVTSAFSGGETIVNAKGRGVLGTLPAAYDVDTSQAVSNRTKVEENIYYELPALKMAYAILTGNLFGSSPISSIPSHHSLGISTDWVSTSKFTQFTDDLWDAADDTKGVILRFDGLKKTNAKKFIEEELLFWTGTFTPILPTGEIGLQRMTGVLSDAAHTGVWNEDNVLNINNVRYDLNDMHNNVAIDWNYDSVQEDFTRALNLTDSDSITRWGTSKTLQLKSKGLHGSIHTDNILGSMFNTWRDRYSSPPFKASVTLDYTQRNVKVGEVKRLQLDHIPQFMDQDGNYQTFDASVEIQRVSVNHTTGTITADVFGSSHKATPLVLGADSSPIADAWFTSEGVDLSTVTTNTISGGSPGTICTIDGASSITGADDLSSASPNGIYYWDGDLNISAQLNITKNIELRVNGFVTFNSSGKIDGKGAGLTGGTTGQAGAIGNSQAGGGLVGSHFLVSRYFVWNSTESALVEGVNNVRPTTVLVNNGGTSITGRPTNGMGTSGGKGGDFISGGVTRQTGSNGGDGGASLTIYCKGASGVSGSQIDLSGDDGAAGVIYSAGTPDGFAGSGAGGQAGLLNLFLIGNTVTETLSDYFLAVNGATPVLGNPAPAPINAASEPDPLYSFYTGISGRDVSRANLLVDWVPDNLTPASDASVIADTGTGITFAENANTPQTPAENLATIDITVAAPSDNSYSHSNVWYKVASEDDAQLQLLPYPAKPETIAVIAMDGTEYTFRAFPVSLTGDISEEFVEENFTVSNAAGGVELATGNYIRTDADPASNGGILLNKDNGLCAYDSNGNLLTEVDEVSGELVYKTSSAGQRIEINPSNDNEIHFYGVRDETESPNVVEELATIGINTVGSDSVIGNFGTQSSTKIGVLSRSNLSGNAAIRGITYHASGRGVIGSAQTSGGIGVQGSINAASGAGVHGQNNYNVSNSAAAVQGQSSYGYGLRGIYISTMRSPLLIDPSASSSAPTHEANIGALWVTSAGVLYIFTANSPQWEKVGAQ